MREYETTRHTRAWPLLGLGAGVLFVLCLVAIITLRTAESPSGVNRSSAAASRTQDPGALQDTEVGGVADQISQLRADLQECSDSSRAALEENARLRAEIESLRVKRITIRNPQTGIVSEGDELRGLRVGEWTEHYSNGQLKSAGSYLEGKEVGEWKYWNADGQLQMKGLWSSGQKVGVWVVFDHEANTVTEVTYVNGVPTEAINK